MGKTFSKPEVLSDAHTHYCPGCTHGVIHRLVAEAIDEIEDEGLGSEILERLEGWLKRPD